MATHPGWQPLLAGDEATSALDVVAEIAAAVATSDLGALVKEFGRSSLVAGHAGLAVFHAALSGDDSAVAIAHLEAAVDAVATQPMAPALYHGFTGIAWAVAHLAGTLFDPGDEDLNESIDEALATLLDGPWAEADLVSGLAGFGVYALERLPHPAASGLLERVVNRLDETAVHDSSGIFWPSPRGPDLGVAHGLPGVIAVLALITASSRVPRAEELLAEAVDTLMRHRLPEGLSARYPALARPGHAPEASRLGWCYGDAGVAGALLVAGRATGMDAWIDEALLTARAAARRPRADSAVLDATFCHGAAGIAHCLNRVYQASGDGEVAAGARAWLRCALELRQPGAGVAGFPYVDPVANALLAKPGFLEGAAGVGLVLHAASTPSAPAWDRFVLLSGRGVAE